MRSFRLRSGRNVFELSQGSVLIGRSPGCRIILDDPLVSRRHASIRVDQRGVTIEDLGSRNAVLVNDNLVRGIRVLAPGDTIRIGEQDLVLLQDESSDDETHDDSGRMQRLSSPTQPPTPAPPESETLPGKLLSDLASRALEDADVAEAEWILGRILAELHYRLAGGELLVPDVDAAAVQVFRLVEITGETSWLDGLFELLTVSGHILPNPFINKLESVLAVLGGSVRLGHYVRSLSSRSAGMTTEERLQVERLATLLERTRGG